MSPLLIAFNSYAEITFNGFASVVAGQTLSSGDTYFGYDDDLDFSPESLLALQVQSDLGEGLGVTAQIISRGVDDWDPEFAWAYVSYDVNDEFRLLAGRQRVPFYMYSDYLDVSYAYTWITPPKGVYSLPIDSVDGLSGIYTTSLGEFDTTFHAVYGNNNNEDEFFGETVRPDYKNLAGISITTVKDWLTLRAGYFRADVTLPVSGLLGLADGWRQAGFNDVAKNVEVDDDSATFYEFGFQVDYEDYLLLAEYTHQEIDSVPLADEDSYYIMAGKRFDSLLFSLTYGKDDSDVQNLTKGVPSGIDPGLDFLKATTDGITQGEDDDSNYVTAGMRWDFHSSAALKLEYTTFSQDIKYAEQQDADIVKLAIVTVF